MGYCKLISGEGQEYPVVYEMRITAMELDVIIRGLRELEKPSDYEKKLLSEYEALAEIRSIRALRRYGFMDSSRLNWH